MWRTTYNGPFFRDSKERYGDSGYVSPKECDICIEIFDQSILITITPMKEDHSDEPDTRYLPIILELPKEDSAAIGRTLLRLGREIKYEIN